jgi:hypothetical protein
MEVYILDSSFRRVEVIDRFESLIWSERWASYGDFEIKIRSTYESRAQLVTGQMLILGRPYPTMTTPTRPHRVMVVETIEDKVEADGTKTLLAKGRSLEAIFEDRVAKETMASLTADPTWVINGVPAAVIRWIVSQICIVGSISANDIVPGLVSSRHPAIAASSIAEPVDPITVELEPKSVYEAITSLANTWTLGYRIMLNLATGALHFDVYAGTDYTMSQTVRPPVLFTPALDNLQDVTELKTIEDAKNVALVFATNGFMEVRPADVPSDVAGFDRRVLVVNASDITLAAGTALDNAMIQRGKEALAEHRAFQAFDGEINQNSQYIYETHYNLGDLVEMRNVNGVANQMRVTEQIFVDDKEGVRAYPTLTINTFVSTGSWLSWQSNKTWSELTTEHWDELP